MNRFKTNSLFATVNKLMITAVVIIGSGPVQVHAETATPIVINNKEEKLCGDDQIYRGKDGNGKPICDDKVCPESDGRLTLLAKEVTTACSKAGYSGVKECNDKLAACVTKEKEKAEEKENAGVDLSALQALFPNQNNALTGFPNLKNAFNNNKKQECPDRAARDYFEDKTKLDKELAEQRDKVKELEEKMTEEKTNFDKAYADAQTDLQKEQKEGANDKREIDQKKRDATKQANEQQAQAAKQIGEYQSKSLELRGLLAKTTREEATAMLQYINDAANLACMGEVRKLRDEYMKTYATPGTDTFASGRQMAKDLKVRYQQCMQGMLQRRQALREEYATKRQQIIDQLNKNDEDSARINDSLRVASQQLTQETQEMESHKLEIDQNALKSQQNAQQKLQNLATAATTKQNSVRVRLEAVNQRIQKLEKEVEEMGPVPDRGVTGSYRDAEKAFTDYAGEAASFGMQCCSNARYQKSHLVCKAIGLNTSGKAQVSPAVLRDKFVEQNTGSK